MVSRKVSASKRSAKRKASKTPRKATKKARVTSRKARTPTKAAKRTPVKKAKRNSAKKRTASRSAKRAPKRTPRKATKAVKARTASKKKPTTPKKVSSKKATTPKKGAKKAVTTPKKSPKKTTTPKKSPKKARTPKKCAKKATTPKKKMAVKKTPARKPKTSKTAAPAAGPKVISAEETTPKVTVVSSNKVEANTEAPTVEMKDVETPKKKAVSEEVEAPKALKSAMKKTSKKTSKKTARKKTVQTPIQKKGPTTLTNLKFRTPCRTLSMLMNKSAKKSALKSAHKVGRTETPVEAFLNGSKTVKALCDFLLQPPKAMTKLSREAAGEVWADMFENARTIGALCSWPVVKKCVDRGLSKRMKALGTLAKLATFGNTGEGYGAKGFGCTIETHKAYSGFTEFCVDKETGDFDNFFRNLPPATHKPDIAFVRQNTATPAYTNKTSWLFHRGSLQITDPVLCCYMDCEPKRSNLRVLYENPDYNAITFHSGVYPAFTREHIVGYIGREGCLSPRQSPAFLLVTFQNLLDFAFPGAPTLKAVRCVRTQQDIASDQTVLTKYYFLLPAGDRGSVVVNFLDSPSF